MLNFVFHAHSGLRYLVLLAALAALVAAAAGWRRVGAPAGAERGLMAAFVGLLDLQVLLGIVLLVLYPFYGALIGHIVMMVVAVIVAHAGSVLARRREPAGNGSPTRVVTIAAALLLIVGGILAIGRSIV